MSSAEKYKDSFDLIGKQLAQQQPKGALKTVKSIRKSLEKDEKSQLAYTYYWEQLCYKHLKDKAKALKAAEMAVQLYSKLEDNLGLSKVTRDTALTLEYIGDFDGALKYIDKSLSYIVNDTSVIYTGITISKKGQILLEKGETKKAEKYIKLGYDILSQTNHTEFTLSSSLPLIMLHLLNGNLIIAKKEIVSAEKLLRKMEKEQGFLNLRRYSEIEGFKSFLYTRLERKEDTVIAFANCLSTFLLSSEKERERVFHSLNSKSVYKAIVEWGMKETLTKSLEGARKEYKEEITKIMRELE